MASLAANQSFPADVYFDVPSGSSWSGVNFAYTSADFAEQAVYAWES